MNIGDLKNYIKDNNLEDSMPIGILDLTTDDIDDRNYPVSIETIDVNDCVDLDEPGEITGKMLFFTFENKLNQNPI